MNTNEFISAMHDNGVEPPPYGVVSNGHLHRYKIDGRNVGWYVFHGDRGSFGDWRLGISVNWRATGASVAVSYEQWEQRKKMERLRKLEKEFAQKGAASRAFNHWYNATWATDSNPYLARKRVSGFGKLRCNGDTLIIPVMDENMNIVNLQLIYANGTKLFLAGGRKKGCCFIITDTCDIVHDSTSINNFIICEGYATGASLFKALHNDDGSVAVVVAFDAGNLEPVSRRIRDAYGDNVKITIAADNDVNGVGLKYARKTAKSCNGGLIMPPSVGMDFNDWLDGTVGGL